MLFVIIIAFMIIGMIVSGRLRSRFREYSKIPLQSGLSGREVAERMLRDSNIHDVKVVSVEGQLTDHYDPRNRTVNLSRDVYHGRSVAAAAVAAHETGHAVQHATAYAFLQMRSALVPVVSLSSRFMNYVFLAGLFFGFAYTMYLDQVLLLIIVAQGAIALFSLITLPVEFDASGRALTWLNMARITGGQEHAKASTALNWAAMTYVVAALSSITMLLYYVMMYMGRRD